MTSTVTRQNSALNINLSTSTDLTPKQGFGSQPLWHPTSRDHTSKKHFKRLGIPPEFPHEWFHTSTSRNRPRSGQTGQKSLTVPYPVMSSIQHPHAKLSLWLTAAESPFIYIHEYGIDNHRLVQYGFIRMCYHFQHRALSCWLLSLQQPLRRVSVSFIQSF